MATLPLRALSLLLLSSLALSSPIARGVLAAREHHPPVDLNNFPFTEAGMPRVTLAECLVMGDYRLMCCAHGGNKIHRDCRLSTHPDNCRNGQRFNHAACCWTNQYRGNWWCPAYVSKTGEPIWQDFEPLHTDAGWMSGEGDNGGKPPPEPWKDDEAETPADKDKVDGNTAPANATVVAGGVKQGQNGTLAEDDEKKQGNVKDADGDRKKQGKETEVNSGREGSGWNFNIGHDAEKTTASSNATEDTGEATISSRSEKRSEDGTSSDPEFERTFETLEKRRKKKFKPHGLRTWPKAAPKAEDAKAPITARAAKKPKQHKPVQPWHWPKPPSKPKHNSSKPNKPAKKDKPQKHRDKPAKKDGKQQQEKKPPVPFSQKVANAIAKVEKAFGKVKHGFQTAKKK